MKGGSPAIDKKLIKVIILKKEDMPIENILLISRVLVLTKKIEAEKIRSE